MTAKPTNHYIDNKTMYTALVKWRTECEDAEAAGKEKPRIPEYIGQCIYHIATRMATKYNFAHYSYNDDMVADALENATNAVYSFNTDKTNNPFGYFSIVIYYAFIRRIQKEKKQLYVKYKLAEAAKPSVEAQMHGSQETMPLEDILGNPYMQNLAKSFEAQLDGTAEEKKPASGTWMTKKARIKAGLQKK